MDKRYDHSKFEKKIYNVWEKSGAFSPHVQKSKKPYTILMPPPNANASLHAGHAMYTVDDILVRWKRMQGYAAQWLPGTDHAGFETQFVYEKYLAKKGKSRMDFDRKSLYEDIYKFVEENSGLIFEQFKRLGFSADWSRGVFTLDENVVQRVFKTFKKMHDDGYIYRDKYLVNYCTHCGTSLADLEVKHVERKDPLYYMRYGPFVLATVRPETKFGDTAVAVHPDDRRYKKYIGKTIEIEGLLAKVNLKVIADKAVDPEFGTGVVKVTPAHDPNDFEMAKRHGLEVKQVIDLRGKLNEHAGKYQGLKVMEARELVAKDLEKAGLMDKVDSEYVHSVSTCYRCGRDLEPLPVPNWFVKVDELKAKVKKAVEADKVKFIPARHKKTMLQWLEVMHDWPISRQIVWGIRIPVWYEIADNSSQTTDYSRKSSKSSNAECKKQNDNIYVVFLNENKEVVSGNVADLLDKYTLAEIETGLQKVIAPPDCTYVISDKKPEGDFLPETDTFDTWFSSGQWSMVTLKKNEMETHYPTDVLGTLSDILTFWVSRMIMFGLYLEDDVPFRDVYLWSMVADKDGKKMSKSRGNVIDPIELVDKYGADALRMSLVYGIPAGGKVILSDDKVRGMRNFANKLWNVARFIFQNKSEAKDDDASLKLRGASDEWILNELEKTTKAVTESLEKYHVNMASETIYEFVWHKFADVYIEKTKDRREEAQPTLEFVLNESLKLLHPFMPFVTEAIWSLGYARDKGDLLITASWPET